jgi:hypothetical protein
MPVESILRWPRAGTPATSANALEIRRIAIARFSVQPCLHDHRRTDPRVGSGSRSPSPSPSPNILVQSDSTLTIVINSARRDVKRQRILRKTGRCAGRWSHSRATGKRGSTATGRRSRRLARTSIGARPLRRGAVAVRITVPWIRSLPLDACLTDLRSHSYVGTLACHWQNTGPLPVASDTTQSTAVELG